MEIHKFRCAALRKEMAWKPGRGLETGLMMNGPIEEVEKTAEMNAKDNKYPGWKKAECCFK